MVLLQPSANGWTHVIMVQVGVGRSPGFDPSRYDLGDAENGGAGPLEGPGSPTYHGPPGQSAAPLGGHLLVSTAIALGSITPPCSMPCRSNVKCQS